jgi:transcriptional regulator with PAS, ATPase and Fis domain
LLVDHLIETYNRVYDREVTCLSPEALFLLMNHDFPGNVRELQNILEHAFVLCHSGMIEAHHLPPYLRQEPKRVVADTGGEMNLREVEKILIREALRKHEGNRSLAARDLGIDPSTLYRKIRQLDIDAPKRDGRGRRLRH